MCKGCGVTLCCLFLLLLSSCSGKGVEKGGTDSDKTEAAYVLPLPVVPDSIRDTGARAAYVAMHFWDGLDLGRKECLEDSDFLEQSFSNFLPVLEMCGDTALAESVDALLRKARTADKAFYVRLLELAEKYLWDVESPFRSDRLFLPFVDFAAAEGGPASERLAALRYDVIKNFPGTVAPGFVSRGRNGDPLKVNPGGEGRMLLLMFYEPDCETCRRTIDYLSHDAGFADAVARGEFRFVAVYPGDDTDEWHKSLDSMPPGWEVGMDEEGVIDSRELYLVRATPSFYLIGADGRIIGKDMDLNMLLRYFAL